MKLCNGMFQCRACRRWVDVYDGDRRRTHRICAECVAKRIDQSEASGLLAKLVENPLAKGPK